MYARLDSKGRILIPQPLRWLLGKGDVVWVEEREGGLVVKPAGPKEGPFVRWARERGPGGVDEAAFREAEEGAWSP